ncbi:hypothetical protein [Rhizohabitans arisaemae]|uniref:hypothetical protein n=1 Tax=Rhizohabitans arisaemae TaxID=2720610 RepID=UPI0024B23851|nr:hypothetical protein [Rhizohabitans arisaemae]
MNTLVTTLLWRLLTVFAATILTFGLVGGLAPKQPAGRQRGPWAYGVSRTRLFSPRGRLRLA